MRVHVSSHERQVLVLGHLRFVALNDRIRVVEPVQVQEIVSKIDRRFRVLWQLLKNFVTQVCGGLIIVSEGQVTLALTHNLRRVVDDCILRSLIHPVLGDR